MVETTHGGRYVQQRLQFGGEGELSEEGWSGFRFRAAADSGVARRREASAGDSAKIGDCLWARSGSQGRSALANAGGSGNRAGREPVGIGFGREESVCCDLESGDWRRGGSEVAWRVQDCARPAQGRRAACYRCEDGGDRVG